MYPWYRESVSQFCGTASPMPTTIKTENGYNDCMLALDYAAQSKFVVTVSVRRGEASAARRQAASRRCTRYGTYYHAPASV
ncbi:hypothetical protein J6590_020351 [Homalodisca vitripennis]|nr:hypothetical protein J6590_020351 [Homalodisca vitripennis]